MRYLLTCLLAARIWLMPDFQRSVSVAVKTMSVTPYMPFMPLLLGRVRGNSAAGPGARAPSFPRKRVGGVPGAYERQIRKNRTRSYMNGWTATANLRKRGTLFLRKLRSSCGILTDERNSYVLCYGNGYGNGYGTLEIRHNVVEERATVTFPVRNDESFPVYSARHKATASDGREIRLHRPQTS